MSLKKAAPPKPDVIFHPSPNFGDRKADASISILLLHYTDMKTGEAALERLCDPVAEVSAHYLIERDGWIFQMVADDKRAWHAGRGHWAGCDDINSHSIGIELVNDGHSSRDLSQDGPEPFPALQIEALIELSDHLCAHHHIQPRYVLGHSDIAPERKQDPGHWFPWDRLANAGIGLWPDGFDIPSRPTLQLGDTGEAVLSLQQKLAHYGYQLELSSKFDRTTELIIIAFQRHFRPSNMSGVADAETQACLEALLGKIDHA